jgi:hypothetical protein
MADDNRDPFTMRPGARNASGYALHGGQPEAPQGSVPSPDNFGVTRQDAAKEQGTPGSYIHPHVGGRSLP